MKSVKLLKDAPDIGTPPGHRKGEIVGLADTDADRLVSEGVAAYSEPEPMQGDRPPNPMPPVPSKKP